MHCSYRDTTINLEIISQKITDLEPNQFPESPKDPLEEMLPLAVHPLTTAQNLLGCEESSSLKVVVEKRAPLKNISRNSRPSPPDPVAGIWHERHHHPLFDPLSNQFPVSGVIIQILRLQSSPRRKDQHTRIAENEIAEPANHSGVEQKIPNILKRRLTRSENTMKD